MTTKFNKLPEWTAFICPFNALSNENILEHCGQATSPSNSIDWLN